MASIGDTKSLSNYEGIDRTDSQRGSTSFATVRQEHGVGGAWERNGEEKVTGEGRKLNTENFHSSYYCGE
jgi:hypothetical protein